MAEHRGTSGRARLRKRVEDAVKRPVAQAPVAALVAAHLRRAYARTTWEHPGRADFAAEMSGSGPAIVVYWHGRLMSLATLWDTAWGPCSCVTSTAYPGRLAGQVFRRFGLGTVAMRDRRSNRAESLALAREIRAGRSICIAADGPAGPGRQVKTVPLDWARLTGAPIWLVALSCTRYWQPDTWDRMLVPRAGGRACLLYRRWGTVPKRLPEADMEALRARLQDDLDAVTDEADRRLGHPVPLG